MKCVACEREDCRPIFFRLCGECDGLGCPICKDSLVPGILRVDTDPEDGIQVCSQWADPEIEAAVHDSHASLLRVLAAARDTVRRGR